MHGFLFKKNLLNYMMIKFEDYKFMQLGGNCAWLAMQDRATRIRGPMDNTILFGVNGIKLLIENKFYNFIKNTPFTKKLRTTGIFEGDYPWFSTFPNNTVRFVHNEPKGEHFFKNLKKRCDTFNTFLKKVKENKYYYFIITLNQEMLEWQTGKIKDNKKLFDIIKYLNKIHLLDKVIFIGCKVVKIDYNCFDYYLKEIDILKLKKQFLDFHYIEITDVNIWDQAHAEEEFKNKVTNLLTNLPQSKIKSYLGSNQWGI